MLFAEPEMVSSMMAFYGLKYFGVALLFICVGAASISTGAGCILGCATVLVNDIIKGWLFPKASNRSLLAWSRVLLIVLAAAILGFVYWWRSIGFSFSGMYQAMGIAFSSTVVPLFMVIFSKRTNRNAVFWSVIIPGVVGLYYWIVGTNMDLLWGVVWGNIIVMCGSAAIVIIWTILSPEEFDYKSLKDKGFEFEAISVETALALTREAREER